MKCFRIATVFKIIFAMGVQGMQPIFIEDNTDLDDYDVSFDISHMVIEFIYALVLYVTFRPRPWPNHFFTLKISLESKLNEVL